jgi:hypothetical protein
MELTPSPALAAVPVGATVQVNCVPAICWFLS